MHKLPLLPFYIGYCPKVDPSQINWEKIKQAGRENKCAVIRFDCPDVIANSGDTFDSSYLNNWSGQSLVLSPRNTFSKHTILLDLAKSEEELLAGMKPKTRYNVRYTAKKGIKVKEESDQTGLENFIKLQRQTATRQKFHLHSDDYYRKVWQVLHPAGMAYILTAYHQDNPEPLVSWMLFNYQGVLYYPYGGSSTYHRNLFPSEAVMWAAIKLGQRLNCRVFDMWGATPDKNDPWWGFTKFKLGFGGKMVEFSDSYDLVLNPLVYRLFVWGYRLFWRVLSLRTRL